MSAAEFNRRNAAAAPHQLTPPPQTKPVHPGLPTGATEATNEPAEKSDEPMLPEFPANADATKPGDSTVAADKAAITPLPAGELPNVEPVPMATEAELAAAPPPATTVENAAPTGENAAPMPSEVAAPMPSEVAATPAAEPSVAAEQPVAPVMELPAVVVEPQPVQMPAVVALPVETVIVQTTPFVEAQPQMTASSILADPAIAERLSSSRPQVTESERLTAALDAARQASLNRPEAVMTTDSASSVAVDMPVISDAAPMASASDMPTSVPQATADASAAPAINENAVAMISDMPAKTGVAVLAPPILKPEELSQPQSQLKPEVLPAIVSDTELDAESKAALSRLNETIGNNPADVQARLLRGNLFVGHNDFAAAVIDFDEILKLDPAHYQAHYGRAQGKYRLGRFADAIDDYSAVLKADDQQATALLERGHCSAMLGKAADAERDRAAALALDPSLAKTGPKYGAAFAAQPTESQAQQVSAFGNLFGEKNTAAPAQAEKAVFVSDADRPQVPEVVHAYVGDDANPEAEIRAASAEISKAPGNAMLYVRRAQAAAALGRYDDALDDLTAALRLDPECAVAKTLRDRVEAARGK
jgi:tetratricopeptide (TPR) repeat protein